MDSICICRDCRSQMNCSKTGIIFVYLEDNGTSPELQPFQAVYTNQWTCPLCQTEVLVTTSEPFFIDQRGVNALDETEDIILEQFC